MTVDLYKPCPCGSGKKIKFCCREIANDLERVQRMIEGEQRLAAIDKIDSLLKKHKDHTALLMMKAEVLMQMQEFENANPIIEQLLEVDETNPSAHALVAMKKIVDGVEPREVLYHMQNSIQYVKEVMTRTVYDAIYSTVGYLLSNGYPFSAKGYLQFAIMVSDGKDSRCISMLNQLNRSKQIPFLIREHIDSGARPPNVTWGREFDVAMQVASRGLWGKAIEMLRNMSYRILDEPSILRNLAIVLALNAEPLEAAKVFRQFAGLRRIPQLDRVHAMALANIFDPRESGQTIDLVQVDFAVADVDAVMEKLLSLDVMQNLPVEAEMQPPPKGVFEFLDRPVAKQDDDKEFTSADVSRSLGRLLLFGRQTDRDPRIEFLLTQGTQFEATIDQLKNALGDLLGEQSDPQVLAPAPRLSTEVFGILRFPDHVKAEKRQEIQEEIRREAISDRWTNLPNPALQGKTPKEAAGDESLKLPLMAELLQFEIETELDGVDFQIEKLYADLDVTPPEPIDVNQRPIKHVPVSHLGRVDIEALSDDELLEAYRYSFAVFAGGILRKIAMEISKREGLDEKIDKVEVYDVLSDLAQDTDEALEWLEKARKLATSQGESPAMWLIDEMQIRLIRGEGDRFEKLLREVQTRYAKEPGVPQALLGMLQRFGLVTPDGRPVQMPEEGQEAQAVGVGSDSGGLWTPDSDAGASKPSDGDKGESKLWVPD